MKNIPDNIITVIFSVFLILVLLFGFGLFGYVIYKSLEITTK